MPVTGVFVLIKNRTGEMGNLTTMIQERASEVWKLTMGMNNPMEKLKKKSSMRKGIFYIGI